MVRREVYDQIGGHAAIRDRVAADLELARLVKGSGHRLVAGNGRALVSVRMYTSLSEIWWGFVKNASAGAGRPWRALGGVFLIGFSALPFFAAPFLRGPQLALAGCTVALAQRGILFALLFPPAGWALSLPLATVCFMGILIHSAVRQLRGKGPLWKGREYPHGR